LKNCQILHDVQEYQLVTAKNVSYSAIDCTEESRYQVKTPAVAMMGAY
jgi:hypothetical protein